MHSALQAPPQASNSQWLHSLVLPTLSCQHSTKWCEQHGYLLSKYPIFIFHSVQLELTQYYLHPCSKITFQPSSGPHPCVSFFLFPFSFFLQVPPPFLGLCPPLIAAPVKTKLGKNLSMSKTEPQHPGFPRGPPPWY